MDAAGSPDQAGWPDKRRAERRRLGHRGEAGEAPADVGGRRPADQPAPGEQRVSRGRIPPSGSAVPQGEHRARRGRVQRRHVQRGRAAGRPPGRRPRSRRARRSAPRPPPVPTRRPAGTAPRSARSTPSAAAAASRCAHRPGQRGVAEQRPGHGEGAGGGGAVRGISRPVDQRLPVVRRCRRSRRCRRRTGPARCPSSSPARDTQRASPVTPDRVEQPLGHARVVVEHPGAVRGHPVPRRPGQPPAGDVHPGQQLRRAAGPRRRTPARRAAARSRPAPRWPARSTPRPPCRRGPGGPAPRARPARRPGPARNDRGHRGRRGAAAPTGRARRSRPPSRRTRPRRTPRPPVPRAPASSSGVHV